MKPFINKNFLLQNKTAEKLYYNYAENQPIIDFHCHLSPAMIAEDRQFNNLTEAWLEGDHYKWRAMRTNGISETYCTGNASDSEKFNKWADDRIFDYQSMPILSATHKIRKDTIIDTFGWAKINLARIIKELEK